MIEITTIAQAIAVVSACWAIISGVGAWKREFIGKRQIELAEQILSKFFEVKDAIAFIRNPYSSSEEGKTRQKGEGELPFESDHLDRGYVVTERYLKKEKIFNEFFTLKYKFMASFGPETEQVFIDTNKALHTIFVSARILATRHWQRQGRIPMENDELQKHLNEMHHHEEIFWDSGSDTDEIRMQLKVIQDKLEKSTASCFQEPMRTYKILTEKWFDMTEQGESNKNAERSLLMRIRILFEKLF